MQLKFEPRDIWIGVYWTRKSRVTTLENDWNIYQIYICLIPCFPLILTFKKLIPKHLRHINW